MTQVRFGMMVPVGVASHSSQGSGTEPEGTGTGSNPVIVFVLGVGRSGSSALARVLSLSGAALPTGLIGATKDNLRGCWEPRAVVHLSQAILGRLGSSGYDPSLAAEQDALLSSKDHAYWIATIRAYLLTLPAAPLIVIKEPKLTAICSMWFEAARAAGFEPAVVIPVRHPAEVIESLASRAGRRKYLPASPEITSAWWLRNLLMAERYTRNVPRVFVGYSNLLTAPDHEVKRISSTLCVALDHQNDDAIAEFLDPGLRHYQNHSAVPEPFGNDWISVVYESLYAAASDQAWDEAALDRVFEEYAKAERGFRRVFDDHRRYRILNRFLRPSIVRVGLGALALAHRRRGTWA